MEPKIIVHFIGKKSRLTSHRLLPIYLRVTIDGKRFEVTTHQHTELSQWIPVAGKVPMCYWLIYGFPLPVSLFIIYRQKRV